MISLQKINRILNLLKWIFLFDLTAAAVDSQQQLDTYSNILATNNQNISTGVIDDFFNAQHKDSAFDAEWIEKIALRKYLINENNFFDHKYSNLSLKPMLHSKIVINALKILIYLF